MCGIAGAFGRQDDTLVPAMTEALRHRGPDQTGHYDRGTLRLGAQRLSVVDVEGGSQPLYDESGTICVVANGEIYNHRELRADLRARGHRFATRCDSEVIVHLYEEYGDRCVEHLEGMFAFALADGDRLLLARDRLGIKPLYHATTPDGELLLFASEIKALLRCPRIAPELDLQSFADTVALNHPVGDRTLFKGISTLPPGHTMVVLAGERGPRTRLAPYYRLPGTTLSDRIEPLPFEAATRRLTELLRESVRSHLDADVEVGLTLSGGVDSSLLAVLMREEYGRPFRTFTVADHADHPDAVQAARLAAHLGCRHEAMTLSVADHLAAIPDYILASEQPVGSLSALPLLVLSRRIGRDLKVCLDGEGADEVFGGYPEYVDRASRAPYVTRQVRLLEEHGMALSPRAREIHEVMTAGVPFPRYLRDTYADNLADQLVRQHLEPLDSRSMASSVEVRVPYLDRRVVEFVLSLPMGHRVDHLLGLRKQLLRRAVLAEFGGVGPLVDSALRQKIGAPSSGHRHTRAFHHFCARLLPPDYLARHELGWSFRRPGELLLFEVFQEIFMAHRGTVPDGFSLEEFIAERAGRPLSRTT